MVTLGKYLGISPMKQADCTFCLKNPHSYGYMNSTSVWQRVSSFVWARIWLRIEQKVVVRTW